MAELKSTTLDVKAPITEEKTAFGRFLVKYSEFIYIYPAVPTFLLGLIGLLTGVILFVHNSEYQDCKNSSDMLFGFLLGQMIFYYSFALIYANTLFQVLPFLHTLTVTFSLFLSYFTLNTGWSLWGISVLIDTGCDGSVYAGMAGFTIAFTLCFDLILLIGFIALIIKKNSSEIAPEPRSKPAVDKNDIVSNDEQPSNIVQNPGVEEGWKEENLDDFN